MGVTSIRQEAAPQIFKNILISTFGFCQNVSEGFFDGLDGKESACNVGDLGSIPGLGRSPGGGHGNSLQYSCLEKPQGQRSLVGYNPWGRKELDMTERLSTAHNMSEGIHESHASSSRSSL